MDNRRVLDKICDPECIKDGQVHEFDGPVKVILGQATDKDEKWRRFGASLVSVANVMIAGNIAIDIVYALTFRDTPTYSLHCLLCTVGVQFCLPMSILALHSMHGPAATLKKRQRLLDHIILSIISTTLFIVGSCVTINEPRRCTPKIHTICAKFTLCGLLFSIATGFWVAYNKNEEEQQESQPNTPIAIGHKYLGMFTLLGASLSYLTSIGECRGMMYIWLYAIGYKAPISMIYGMVIFYTLIIMFLPGSLFYNSTKYVNFCETDQCGSEEPREKTWYNNILSQAFRVRNGHVDNS